MKIVYIFLDKLVIKRYNLFYWRIVFMLFSLILSYSLYLTVILIGHTVADFFLQTDWMAKNKSSDIQALSLHVITYTTVFAVFVFICNFFMPIKFLGSVAFVLLNGVLHFITDFFTSRISKKYWLQEKRHEFFVTIGVDQLIHILCIFWLSWLVLVDKLCFLG